MLSMMQSWRSFDSGELQALCNAPTYGWRASSVMGLGQILGRCSLPHQLHFYLIKHAYLMQIGPLGSFCSLDEMMCSTINVQIAARCLRLTNTNSELRRACAFLIRAACLMQLALHCGTRTQTTRFIGAFRGAWFLRLTLARDAQRDSHSWLIPFPSSPCCSPARRFSLCGLFRHAVQIASRAK